jgi:hypothetical protein
MTEPDDVRRDGELDDPGRDPKGLTPPRNPFGGGPDQDSGRGEPAGTGNVGPGDKPEPPTEDPEERADSEEDEPAED